MLTLTKVAVILPAAVGTLNQARAARLEAIFKDVFPLVLQPERGPGIAFANQVPGDMVIVEPQRVLFQREMPEMDLPNLEQWAALAGRVSDALLLDPPTEFGMNFVGLLAVGGSTMEKSFTAIRDGSTLRETVAGLQGIGFRLILRDGQMAKGDLKIEPLIADHTKGFAELVKVVAYPGDFGTAFRVVANELESFCETVTRLASILLPDRP